jgi:hypothetical protein
MRVIPFPGGSDTGPDESWLVELEAALNGTGKGPRADSWRELRDEVRTLAPPISPEFARELGERIAERHAHSVPQRSRRPKQQRRFGWPRRPVYLGASAIVVISVVIALVVLAGPRRAHAPVEANPAPHLAQSVLPSARAGATKGPSSSASSGGAGASGSASAAAASNAPASSGATASPGRVQQLGASITLMATPEEVQTVADRVSRLTTSEGGFVRSSHVNEEEQAGEANLMLSLPSAKLSAALASLGRLAPVRSESQSLQDITNTYDEAQQRLNEATAERRALLRALARASTEGEIDSLRARLAQSGGTIARAREAFGTVSKQASTAEVEVTVVGDKHASSEGLSLHRGLHDAGRVLTGTLVVLLIAAAVLVPLALVAIVFAIVRRAWLRHRRELTLDRG